MANKASENQDKKYFSWLKDKRITDMFDAYEKINIGLAVLVNAKHDTGAAMQYLQYARNHHVKFIERIDKEYFKKSS